MKKIAPLIMLAALLAVALPAAVYAGGQVEDKAGRPEGEEPSPFYLTVAELMANEKTAAVMRNRLPDLVNGPDYPSVKNMELKRLLDMAGDNVPPEEKAVLEKELREALQASKSGG